MESDEEILATHEVMAQLRPHIPAEEYLPMVRRMMGTEGYRLTAVLEEGKVRAVAGYRFMEMLYCGRILYVDDLITDEQARSRGHGKRLLDWLKEEARAQGCAELHLDSGTHREHAHRFYFREGLTISSFHFRLKA
jgi:GNAT superfamily N-acetyltransferase